MEQITDEQLKDAICNNDLIFLNKNIGKYSINHQFEDEDNDTLLSYAISDPGSDIYSFFLEKNADTELINDEGENILHAAVFSGDLKRIKMVLNDRNINGQSNDGSTPLILSIGLKKDEVANFLIENGVDINLADLADNKPIHLASFFGLQSVVMKLIDKGADLHCKTEKGNLPLALAVNEGHVEVAKILFNEMYF